MQTLFPATTPPPTPAVLMLPPSLLITMQAPVHRTPRGGGKMPLTHHALSVRSSACLEEWEGWNTGPSRKRKARF